MEGSTLLATAVANTYRADLKNSGQGTGNYGFSIALPASIKNGQPHQLSVRIKGSSVVLSGSPKTVTCAALPQLSGSFEKADCNTVNGWVWASNYPDSAFTVELLEGSVVVGTTVAGNYRVDLKDAGKGTGKYGFSLAVPASLKTGQARQLSVRVKGSSYILSGSPRTITCATPYQLSGQLEQADCGTVRGWAWASNYPDSAFTVELLEGSTLLATAVANTYRADLKNSGQGTGNYGFSIALPASIKNGQPHQLSVRIKGSSVVLSGSPKTVTCAALPQLSGSFEKADCNTVNGWVWASNYPDSAFTVELLEGSVVVGTTVAGNYRVDLKNAGKGTGKYGFSLAVPASLKTGQARQLSVRVKGSSYILSGSPRTITCATPFQLSGQLEQADCGTVRGWAWASNYPDSAFTVELLEGSTLLATAVANTYRADLKNSGQGTGNYGFSIALPASIKNGQPHQLSVRIKGSSVVLSGSPKTVTCAALPQLSGSFEKADCNTVNGWVWASNYPDSAFTVELLEGSVVVGTTVAGNYRVDLKDAGKGTGKYGFSLAVPASLKTGQARQLSVRVKGSSYILSGSPRTITCATPFQLSGQLEQADCGTVRGWAWASNYPDSAFTVELLEGSTLLATAVANTYRADLKNSGQGTGNYGFSIALPASIKNGQPHQLSVRIKGSSVVLSGSPKTVTCAALPQLSGSFEKADCNTVNGWVWASNYPDSAFTVELLEGSVVVGTTVAGNYRVDLKDGGKGTGKYGFSLAVPASLKTGQARQLSVRVKGSSYILSGSPRTITCATPYQLSGQLEQADCGTVRGWAWASNYPDSAFTVELLEGSTLLATAVANTYRADLKNSGQGTGNYGFSIALPASIKNGQPHQLSVRIKGSSVVLSGSPKTVTCAALPQLSGSFEKADCNTVNGWVWASNYPDSAFTVELLEGSVVVGTTVAGNYRVDLKNAGKGTGKYGFSLAVPASLKTGQARQLSVRVKGSSYILSGSPRTITCAVMPQLSGNFEMADCNMVKGWVWAVNFPDSAFTVELLEGSTLLATAVANIYRADLKNAGKGTGNYGFSMALPASLKNGQPHQLSIRIKGSSNLLSGSPKTVTCSQVARIATIEEIETIPDKLQELDYELVLAPNPTDGRIVVSFKLSRNHVARLSILNILGNIIAEETAVGNDTGISRQSYDLTAQANGVYFFRLKIGDKVGVKRFVITK
ncbi:T9SS type A sorting domain-containing protein [Dyadobacter sp. MSC1_007]